MDINELHLEHTLSKEETNNLLRLSCNGDLVARDKLIIHNQKLVLSVARKYSKTEEHLEDNFAEGIIGLVRAVDTFSYEKIGKISFSSYAVTCIANSILMAWRRRKHDATLICTSLEEVIADSKKEVRLADIIPSDDDLPIDFIYREEKFKKLYRAILKLNDIDQQILKRTYGVSSLEELCKQDIFHYAYGTKYSTQYDKIIGESLGLKRTTVCNRRKYALEKIKQELLNNFENDEKLLKNN